jgi:type I restriction enzyme S subunit
MKINMPYKIVPLSEVVYFQEGPGLRNWQYANEGIPFLNIRTLTDEGFINKSLCQCVKKEEFTNKYEHFLLDEGDFVVSSSGTLGKLAEVRKQDLPIMLNTSVIRFRPLDTNILDRDFLKWFIKSPLYFRQIESASTGTAIKNYGPSHLKKMVIPLPPIASQRRIADILDKADEIIRKRKEAIALTEQLQKSIFLDMFGDPVTNPKGWEIIKFSKVCERITVGVVVKPASYYVNSGVPAIRSLNIKPGKIVLDDVVFFSKEDNDTKLSKTKLKARDLILVRSGQPGTAAVVPQDLDGINAIDILIVTPIKKLIDPDFLCSFFNSSGGRSLVLSEQRGQIQKHLNVGSLSKSFIPFPPLELQKDFSLKLTKIEKIKRKKIQSLQESENLFNSLLQRAFKGEL